jgi:hypothetical protein
VTELNLDDAVLEIEFPTELDTIDAELDFQGEIIRADDEALEKEFKQGYDKGFDAGVGMGYSDGFVDGQQDGIKQGETIWYEKGEKDGYNKGYQFGFNEGLMCGEEEGYDKGHSEGYAEGYEPAYRITALANLYTSAVFPENAELSLRVARLFSNDAQYMLRLAKNLKKMSLVVESSDTGLLNMQGFVRENTDIEVVDFSKLGVKINYAGYFALGATKLRSIYGALDFSECTGATIWLNGANALEDIEFVPNTINISLDFYWCAYLTPESVDSIIDGLADLTGKTSQKVTFHADVINRLTTEQGTRILNKNWTFS